MDKWANIGENCARNVNFVSSDDVLHSEHDVIHYMEVHVCDKSERRDNCFCLDLNELYNGLYRR